MREGEAVLAGGGHFDMGVVTGDGIALMEVVMVWCRGVCVRNQCLQVWWM